MVSALLASIPWRTSALCLGDEAFARGIRSRGGQVLRTSDFLALRRTEAEWIVGDLRGEGDAGLRTLQLVRRAAWDGARSHEAISHAVRIGPRVALVIDAADLEGPPAFWSQYPATSVKPLIYQGTPSAWVIWR